MMAAARAGSYVAIAAIVTTAVVGVLHAQGGAAGPSQPGSSPYEEVKDWPQLPPDVKLNTSLSGVIGLLPDDHGNVWIVQRGTPAILRVDRNGKLLTSFHHPSLYHTHGLCM